MLHRGLLCLPDCSRCPLRLEHGQVPPEGNHHAEIALVGMGPGYQEAQQGHPFVGPSGQLLNRILDEAGLRREALWVTNAALCLPVDIEFTNGARMPKGRVEKETILKHCRSRVLNELRIVAPKVVVAFGTLTMEALTDDVKGVTQVHGSLNRLSQAAGHEAIVIPLFHPAHLLRGEQRFYPAVVEGLKRAKRLAAAPPQPLGELFIIDPCSGTIEADLRRLAALVEDILRTGEDIAVDVETTYEDAMHASLTVVGFGSATRRLGVAVTVRSWCNETGRFVFNWTARQWARVNAIIARLLIGNNTKIYWNFGFDVTVLSRFYRLGGPVRDGMVLHHLAYPDQLHRLNFAVQTFLDVPPWKYHFQQLEKAGRATQRDLLIYNAQDALYTALVFPILVGEVFTRRNLHLEDHQLYQADMARRAHINGLPFDAERWRRIYFEHEQLRYGLLEYMREEIRKHPDAEASLNFFIQQRRIARARHAGKPDPAPKAPITVEDWNPDSADHGSWFLYDLLKLQPKRWTSGGAERDWLKRTPSHSYKGVLTYMENKLVKAYVKRAETEGLLRKLREIREKIDPLTGRLHPQWNTIGMAGTRWVSKINVQNLTELIKQVFVQPPDRCWIGADAAQIEYRISAFLAGIEELLTLFNGPLYDEDSEEEGWKKYDPRYDAHSLLAAEVFGNYYLNGTPKLKKALRTMVKRVVYALFYGATPLKIYETILEDHRVPADFRAVVTLEKIEQIHAGFTQRFMAWPRWVDDQIMQVRTRGVQVFPPFNRHLWWALKELVEETKIRNKPIQLAAGDVVNALFRRMDEEARQRNLDMHFASHVHDACEWDVALKDKDAAMELINRNFDVWLERLTQAGKLIRVHIYGQAKTGRTLADV